MIDVTESHLATAARILADATVVLLHTDVVSCDVAQQRSLGEREVLVKRHLPLWKKANVAATFETVGGTTMHQTFPTRSLHRTGSSYTLRALELIDAMLSDIAERPDCFVPLRTGSDASEARRAGRVAIGFSFEGGEPIGDDLSLLRTFWRLGVRMIQPVWLTRNQFGASFRQPDGGGLTGLGIELVQEMGRLGMLADVSHLNDAGFDDVVRYARGPFIAVHCAALSPTLLESELFGHEKGAFTGATERRKGRFELADGGTLFLDEVSEIPLPVQVKLLRVLEERKFERVGGHETLEVDIRLIAATNTDLRALVKEGRFRSDLFFRLEVVAITLPPLRERLDDLPLLCRHFLKEFSAQTGKEPPELTPEAMAVLGAYAWPGNVRELRNTIERMVVLARGPRLTVRDIPPAIRQAVHPEALKGVGRAAAGLTTAPTTIQEGERLMIETALRRCNGNRTRAAQQLGISRRTLQRKLKAYHAAEKTAIAPPSES